jgi:hypothetical protein
MSVAIVDNHIYGLGAKLVNLDEIRDIGTKKAKRKNPFRFFELYYLTLYSFNIWCCGSF